MKKRNGFVSNSSSSSFIVRNGSVNIVATSMLDTIIEDFNDWDQNELNQEKTKLAKIYKKWKSNLGIGLSNSKVKKGQAGITMPSCNYKTYIFKKDCNVYVSTANNHQWNYVEIGSVFNREGSDEDTSDIVYKHIEDQRYFNVKNRLIHSKSKWDKDFTDESKLKCPNCKKYFGQYVLVGKKKVCAECYKGIINTKKLINWPVNKIEKEEKELIKLIENRPKIVNVINTLEL